MANEVDDIVTNIVLTGNEEVAAGFDKMREAGERAFEALNKAAEKATSFSGLGVAITGLAASVAIAGVGMFEFVKATSETVDKLSQLARQSGTTVENVSSLSAALAQQGVSTSELGQSYRQLSRFIEQSWTDIKKASRDGADQLRGDALSVKSAELALTDAQRAAGNVDRDNAAQRIANLTGIKGAQAALDAARLNERKARGEDVAAEEALLQKQQAALAVEQAQLALATARRKARDDAIEASEKAEKAAIAAETAELALNAARKKASDDAANDINNVTKAVQALAGGNEDALKGINASAENIAKGIVNAAGQGEKALEGLSGGIKDLTKPAPEVQAVFNKLAEVFEHTNNNALKSAVAMRLFGRAVGQEMIDALSQGPEALKAFQERIEKLGLAVNDVDVEVSEKFRRAMLGLVADVELLAVKLSTALGPGFTTLLTAIDTAITNNKDKIIGWATSIASTVFPIMESLIRILTGVPDAAKDEWIQGYIESFVRFAKAVGTAIADIGKALVFLVNSFQKVADDINAAFGTAVDGFEIFVAAFLLGTRTMQGAFAIFGTVVATVAEGLGIALAPFVAGLALAAIGITAVIKLYKALKDLLGGSGEERQAAIKNGTLERLGALSDLASGDFAKGFERFKKANEDQQKLEEQLDARDKITSDNQKKRQDELAAKVAEAQRSMTPEAQKAAEAIASSHEAAAKRVEDTHKKASKTVKDESKKQTDAEREAEVASIGGGAAAGQGTPIKGATANAAAENVRKSLDNLNEQLRKTGKSADGTVTASEPFRKKLQDEFEKQQREPKPPEQTASLPQFKEIAPGVFQRSDLVKTGGISTTDTAEKTDVERTVKPALDHFTEELLKAADELKNPATDRSPDTTIPSGPETVPTQKPASLAEIDPFLDFIRKALNDPAALQEKQRPERPAEQQQTDQTKQQSTLESILSAITEFLHGAHDKLSGATDNTVKDNQNLGIRGEAEDLGEAFQTAADGITESTNQLVAAVTDAANAIAQSASAASDGTVKAWGGGYIRGAGSTTSDSIPAWLSDKEYVHRAAATEHYGVPFMDAINNLRLPKFNLGGMVNLLSPSLPRTHFAGGGAVSAPPGLAGHISVDLRTNHGSIAVLADASAVRQLQHAAVTQRITSTGVKPGWRS